jgi:hypothetical protein
LKPAETEEVKKLVEQFQNELGDEHPKWKQVLGEVLKDGCVSLSDQALLIHDLNHAAAEFCRGLPWTFSVNRNKSPISPKGAEAIAKGKGYRIWAWPNAIIQPVQATGAVRQFWAPYIAAPRIHYVFAEPLFWTKPPKDGKLQTFLRDLASNHEDDEAYREQGYQPSYHYVSAGDVVCRYLIFRYLLESGLTMKAFPPPVAAKNFHWKYVHPNHCVIVVGSGRANFHLDRLKNPDFRWRVANDCVEDNVTNKPVDREHIVDGGVWEHAVISRTAIDGIAGSVLTSISSNHGRAIEACALMTTKESSLSAQLDGHNLKKLPDAFQALIKVRIDKDESRHDKFEIVDIHEVKRSTVIEDPPSAAAADTPPERLRKAQQKGKRKHRR